eukprot:gene18587-biopygen3953
MSKKTRCCHNCDFRCPSAQFFSFLGAFGAVLSGVALLPLPEGPGILTKHHVYINGPYYPNLRGCPAAVPATLRFPRFPLGETAADADRTRTGRGAHDRI